ncbi:MAG TPA: phosphopantetheine-binding protein [Rugosimonospora sp.]|nr:phosphopantetheine-binding protein [Rugosimonospora sp.]
MTESPPTITPERTEAQIRETVLAIIVDMAPNSDAAKGPDTHLVDDLGYHSLALLELAFALEDEFDLEPIDEETARKITTIGAVQDAVIERIGQRDAAA